MVIMALAVVASYSLVVELFATYYATENPSPQGTQSLLRHTLKAFLPQAPALECLELCLGADGA
ncbi:hypothetical protein BC629DRAFT_1681176 [Irpex lacteus]|nr:hypothetical protein BC629DRAFT_1681176 [Irpex lacteus]